LIGDALLADGPGLLLVIEKLPGANTLDVTRGIEAALAELRPGLAGVTLDASIFRAANFIETGFGNLNKALVIAAVLGVLLLGILLYDWRAAAISLVVIRCRWSPRPLWPDGLARSTPWCWPGW
jgi:multidrug efflux pump subunit AcrB